MSRLPATFPGLPFPASMLHSPSIALGVGALSIAAHAVAVLLLLWVWNLTMPQLFNLPRIRFWQAFRLMVIASVLITGGRFGVHLL